MADVSRRSVSAGQCLQNEEDDRKNEAALDAFMTDTMPGGSGAGGNGGGNSQWHGAAQAGGHAAGIPPAPEPHHMAPNQQHGSVLWMPRCA